MTAAALAAVPAAADEMLTDRPDFTESSVAVAPRRIQLETGTTWSRGPGAGAALAAPEGLVRVGLAPRFELRLGLPDLAVGHGDGRTTGRLGDASLGLKIQLAPSGAPVGTALIVSASLPTGGEGETSGAVDPGAALAWSRDLAGGWTAGGLVGWAVPTVDGARTVVVSPTLAIGRPLGGRVAVFGEWAAQLPERGRPEHLLHHGYTLALGPDLQADAHAGVGLSRAAADVFVGAGLVRRW